MSKRQVEVEAYDAGGGLIAIQSFPTYEWYEDLHPLIDSNEERARLGVMRIEGRKYDIMGELDMSWTAEYRNDGSIAEMRESWRDGSNTVRRYPGPVEST